MDPEMPRPNPPEPETQEAPSARGDGHPLPLAVPPPPTTSPERAPVPVPAATPIPTAPAPMDDAERRRLKAARDAARERERAAEKAEKKRKKQDKEEREAAKDERGRRSRGVETLFRTSYMVNMDLTALADSKANIMVSVNGLMITVLVGSVAPGIEDNTWLILPTAILLAGITTALVLGVLAARPRVESREVSMEDVRARRANLLFFGHFANMSSREFVDGMRELMDQPDEVYRTMSADVYGIGAVLQRKYRLLRASYTVFLIGIALGVLAFVGTFIFRRPDPIPERVILSNPAAATAPASPAPVAPPPATPEPASSGDVNPFTPVP